jgi:hypothetical protein
MRGTVATPIRAGEGNVRRVLILMAVSVAALAVSAVAFGGSSSALLQQYSGLAGEAQQNVPVATQAVHTSGTLPFTGLDLALIAAGAMLLMFTGWTLRRVSRKQQ